MDVDRFGVGAICGAKGAKVVLLRRIEGHRDMAVAQAGGSHQPIFVRERSGRIDQRQVNHMPHTDGRKPGDVVGINPARCGRALI